nr:hypothetical protein CFP56_21395 [Quercus suber]
MESGGKTRMMTAIRRGWKRGKEFDIELRGRDIGGRGIGGRDIGGRGIEFRGRGIEGRGIELKEGESELGRGIEL